MRFKIYMTPDGKSHEVQVADITNAASQAEAEQEANRFFTKELFPQGVRVIGVKEERKQMKFSKMHHRMRS